jgi:Nif-specific regulatory protein
MAHQDNLEHYEATEAHDLTRLLRAVRPPAREVQVPPPVDLAIRAAIWQAPVRRQLSTLLSMPRWDLIRVIRQALTDNPLLEEAAPAEDEHAPAGGAHAQDLTAAADDLTAAAERYDSVWQACVPDGWDATDLPAQAAAAAGASERPSSPPEAPVPDVTVIKVGDDYQVVLNEDGLPRLRLRAPDRRQGRESQGGQSEAMHGLDDQLRAAVWLLRSLEYRRRTLSAVAQSLVTRQRAFLDHGPAHLQPLAPAEMAAALGLHASTVRRVVTNKYLATAHGIVALTSCFQSGPESSGGETMASLTVKERITQLVAAEDPAQPLTDQQLVEMLAAEHIHIARRTVTQYRRELELPPANRRQQHGSTAGASPLFPDEEQRVRQALFRRWQAEPPLRRGSEEASGVPPEDEEPQRRRDDEAAESFHQWFKKFFGEVRAARRNLQAALAHPQLRPAVLLALQAFAQAAQAGATTSPPADTGEQGSPREIELAERRKQLIKQTLEQTHGNTLQAAQLLGLSEAQLRTHLTHYGQWVKKISGEVRAARRDLQAALAHPQLRPAVLLALQAFAQAAQAGAPTPPSAGAVEPAPRLQERPLAEALSSIHDLDHRIRLAIERVVTLLDIDGVSIILLDEARQELYFKAAYDSRVGHEQSLRDVRFPANQGIAGWVIHEGQSLIVPDVDQDPRHYRGVDDHTGTKTRSLVCVPLRTQERIIGVLEASNKRQGGFTAEDVRRLETFANQLAHALENAHAIQERYTLDVQQLIAEADRLANRAVPFDTLICESPKMREVYRLVEGVLHTTATVLLTGELGTGKDFIARLLHEQGPRAQGPFIAVNCAALPQTRLEAELFGDERGAGTGATQRQSGCLELAAGGTLFLQEIGAMSRVLQAKFLRVLHEQRFERVGGTETLTTDARIVAATSQDLEWLVAEGRFRRDLFYRLNVYPIALPPLRERREDLGPLTMFFLKSFSQKLCKEVVGISKDALGWLERYTWPGNVRELEEVMERAVARCQGPMVAAHDLPQALWELARVLVWSGRAFTLPPGGIAMADLEKHLIRQALEQAHGNTSHASKILGLSRTQLRTRMRQHGLDDN